MARWSKQPSETGLARVSQGPRGFDLKDSGEVVVRVRPRGPRLDKYMITGWYWYGLGQISLWDNKVFGSADEAKESAMAYFKANKPTT